MVCGDPNARRYAQVIKITDDEDRPVLFNCFLPLGPYDLVQVTHPYKMRDFRALKDFTLVQDGRVCPVATEASVVHEIYTQSLEQLRSQHPG